MYNTKRIIIADDDAAILDAVGLMLELEGYEVIPIKNTAELRLIKSEPLVDLLLLDIWIWRADGREICRELKHNHQTKGLPVILMSASKDIEASALATGADDFLAKPFERLNLLKKIGRFC